MDMTSGWKYRKKITLSNSGGSVLTDYQVKFTIYTTLLGYWIESYASNSAVIWRKIDNITNYIIIEPIISSCSDGQQLVLTTNLISSDAMELTWT